MELALALLVLVAALAVLAYPLYLARPQAQFAPATALDDLMAQRDGVYATLRDLDLDHQLGKLDDHDYAVLREKNLARATEILRALDDMRGTGERTAESEEIEQEVAALRKPIKSQESLAQPTAAPTKAKSPAADLKCPKCGRAYHPGDKFCARCGNALG